MEEDKKQTIDISELYFGKVGNSIKNPLLKEIVHTIFNDRIRKKALTYSFFSIDFKDTKIPWYSNFMNKFFGKVECFFTRNNDMILVYPVLGNSKTSHYKIPEKVDAYIKDREKILEKKEEKWELDVSSIKKSQEGDMYRLEYKGESKKNGEEYTFFEHTVFKGIDKVVFQAFVLDPEDTVLMADITQIARSIKVRQNSN